MSKCCFVCFLSGYSALYHRSEVQSPEMLQVLKPQDKYEYLKLTVKYNSSTRCS